MRRIVYGILTFLAAAFGALVLYAWQQLRHGIVIYAKPK